MGLKNHMPRDSFGSVNAPPILISALPNGWKQYSQILMCFYRTTVFEGLAVWLVIYFMHDPPSSFKIVSFLPA